MQFACDFFVFYVCDKCHEPYYAGHKDCQLADDNMDDAPHQCLKCNRQFIEKICPKNGETGMVIKCIFCCNPSIWFCFGTTYFCGPCHSARKDLHGLYPNCDGHCKFSPHGRNGERKITAFCVLCEQEKEKEMINKK